MKFSAFGIWGSLAVVFAVYSSESTGDSSFLTLRGGKMGEYQRREAPASALSSLNAVSAALREDSPARLFSACLVHATAHPEDSRLTPYWRWAILEADHSGDELLGHDILVAYADWQGERASRRMVRREDDSPEEEAARRRIAVTDVIESRYVELTACPFSRDNAVLLLCDLLASRYPNTESESMALCWAAKIGSFSSLLDLSAGFLAKF